MIKNNLVQIVVAVVLVALLGLIANPYHFWMPSMAHMALLAAVLVAFGIFAAFVLRENATDEREGTHRMLAGRAAFFAGAALLVVGILYESYFEMLDPWLVVVLVAMILTKLGTRLYSDYNQ